MESLCVKWRLFLCKLVFMKYLPAENIVYKTKLKEREVINRLSNYIDEEKLIRFGLFGSSISKAYEGEISKESFDIKRIIGYRNSFLPRINGIIEKDFDGTVIKVKMRLHILVVVFLCIWCGGVGLAFFSFLYVSLNSNNLEGTALIPFGMLIFVYILTMGGFKYESRMSIKDLQTLFEAEIIENN